MKKMPEPKIYYIFMLAALFARFSSGTEITSKSGCLGDSIELFENISLNTDDTVVSLYKNGVENTLIGMWLMQDLVRNSTLINGYNNKLFLDKYGNIWILKLFMSDEAKYTLRVAVGKERKNYGVQLVVLVPPSIQCKPKITRLDNVLTVDLEANLCGKPVASVYWLNHSGISFDGTKAIKLQQGNEEGIYHACIEGDALRCVKSPKSSDYCSLYKVDKEETSQSQEDARRSRNKTTQEEASSDLEGDAKIRNIKEQGDIRSESSMTNTFLNAAMLCLLAVMTIMMVLCLLMIKKNIRRKDPGPIYKGENESLVIDKVQECSKRVETQSPDKEEAQNVTEDLTPGTDDVVDVRLQQSSPRVEQSRPEQEIRENVGNNTAREQTLPTQEGPTNIKANVAEGDTDGQLGSNLSDEHTRNGESANLPDKRLSEVTRGGEQPSTAGEGHEHIETNSANEKSAAGQEQKLYPLKIINH